MMNLIQNCRNMRNFNMNWNHGEQRFIRFTTMTSILHIIADKIQPKSKILTVYI